MYPPNSGHHGKSTQYKTIQTKYVFKTSFDGRSGLFQTTLISHCLTSLLPKPTLILAKSLTSDPYNRGFLFRRKSVPFVASYRSGLHIFPNEKVTSNKKKLTIFWHDYIPFHKVRSILREVIDLNTV